MLKGIGAVIVSLLGLALRGMPALDYMVLHLDRVEESSTRLPRNGYIQELVVLESAQAGSIVLADNQVYELATALPPGSKWRGVQVKDFRITRKEFISGQEVVCSEHLYLDVRSGAVSNGSAYVVNPAGEMTGWATIRRCSR